MTIGDRRVYRNIEKFDSFLENNSFLHFGATDNWRQEGIPKH
jgi:hypothetical protein